MVQSNASRQAQVPYEIGTNPTLAAQAEVVVRNEILVGRLMPGERLVLPALERRLGIGMTPLREALSRLTATGLVEIVGHKGFRVSEVSAEKAVDLIKALTVVDLGALRLALSDRTQEWEERLVLALHRLRRALSSPHQSTADDPYEVAHRALHQALISGCNSSTLIENHDHLFDQVMRHQRVLMSHKAVNRVDDFKLHEQLINCAISDDGDAAVSMLSEHFLELLSMLPTDKAQHVAKYLKAARL